MLQRLRQTRTQIEADLVISRLRAAGLHPSDLRIWPHVTLAGADLFYGVDVPSEELEVADQIIRSAEPGQETASQSRSSWSVIKLGLVLVIVAIAAGMLLP
jgi:hypothetical protein